MQFIPIYGRNNAPLKTQLFVVTCIVPIKTQQCSPLAFEDEREKKSIKRCIRVRGRVSFCVYIVALCVTIENNEDPLSVATCMKIKVGFFVTEFLEREPSRGKRDGGEYIENE